MNLSDFLSENEITLELQASDKDSALREVVALLDLDESAREVLYGLLHKRENLGTTGIGKGVAIPHCRSLIVDRLRVAYARKPDGLDFAAVDDKLVHHLFLIVAPPVEISNQYLPVLGRIAQFCKNRENLEKLDAIDSADQFLAIVNEAEA